MTQLSGKQRQEVKIKDGDEVIWTRPIRCHFLHLPEVKDEAVSFVEAAPGHLHLLGTNVALPFDLVQPVHGP